MNREHFFGRQDRLRRITRRLILLTIIGSAGVGSIGGLATALVHYKVNFDAGAGITPAELAPTIALGAAITLALSVLVVFGHLVVLHLSRSAVRRFFHARDLTEEARHATLAPGLKRLVNIVEEMAIASGTPVPHVLLLDDDESINAFALVQRGQRASVGITAGAQELLSRDELQALVAHELGHIANGDAAINIRLLALVRGFRWIYDAAVAAIGWPFRTFESFKLAFFFTFYLTMVFGVFFVLGLFGVGIARLMQAAIARNREYLADASAVQFTRYTLGLIGALEKADLFRQPRGRQPTKVAAFMMFVSPYRARSWLLRTHPTIAQRIEAAEAMTPGMVPNDAAEGAPLTAAG